MAVLMNSMQLSCKYITQCVRKAGIAGLYGLAGTNNASGDDVKKIDLLSNEVMINSLKFSNQMAVMVSEENEEALIMDTNERGKYCIAFDPLDGSSNIDCNVSTGTIFGIYEKETMGPGTYVCCVMRTSNTELIVQPWLSHQRKGYPPQGQRAGRGWILHVRKRHPAGCDFWQGRPLVRCCSQFPGIVAVCSFPFRQFYHGPVVGRVRSHIA